MNRQLLRLVEKLIGHLPIDNFIKEEGEEGETEYVFDESVDAAEFKDHSQHFIEAMITGAQIRDIIE